MEISPVVSRDARPWSTFVALPKYGSILQFHSLETRTKSAEYAGKVMKNVHADGTGSLYSGSWVSSRGC